MAYVTEEVKQCVVTLLIYVMPERIQPAGLIVTLFFTLPQRTPAPEPPCAVRRLRNPAPSVRGECGPYC